MDSIQFEKIRIRNFMSVGPDEVELHYTPGINTIKGRNYDENESNGAGKTVILCEAPLWCLFGVLMRKLSSSSIINEYVRKGCEASIWFKKGAQRYRVERKIPSELEIYEVSTDGSVEIPAKLSTIDETQAKICRILEADSDIYKNLVIFNINKTKPFSADKLDNKRRIWEYVMNIGMYRDMAEEIKKSLGLTLTDISVKSDIQRTREADLGTAKMNRDKVVRDIDGIKIAVEKKRTEYQEAKGRIIVETESKKTELNRKLGELEPQKTAKLAEARTNLENALKTLTERIERSVKADKERLTKETETLEKLNKDIKILSDIEALLPEFAKKVEKAKTDYLEKNKADKEGYGIVSKIKTKIEILEGEKGSVSNLAPICPTCKREVPEAYKSEITAKYNNSISGLSFELKQEMEKVANTAKEVQELHSKYNELSAKYSAYKQKVEGKLQMQNQAKSCETSISVLKNSEVLREQERVESKNTLQTQHDKAVADLDKSFATRQSELQSSLAGIDSDMAQRLEMYDKLMSELDTGTTATSLNTMLESCRNAIQQKENELKEIGTELDRLRTYADDYEYCKTILSDDGIKKYVIGLILPFANQTLKKYFSVMQAGYVAEFDDALKERYIKTSNGKERDYENFSEGEKKRIDMAMLLTFIDIGMLCGTLNTNLLIFDELLDTSADNSGTDSFMDILYKKAKDENLSVWIISHRESISGIPHDREVTVAKKNEFSYIEIA